MVKASRQGVTGAEGMLGVEIGEGRWRVRFVRRDRVVRLEGGIHSERCWGSGKVMSVLVGVESQVWRMVPGGVLR